MVHTLLSWFATISWLGVCAFALFKGDRPERLAGAALLIAWLATLAVHRETSLTSVELPMLVIEASVLLFLIGLCWKSDRAWPIWAVGFQAITVFVNIVPLIDLRIQAIAYLSARNVGTYGVLTCLAVGTFWAWQFREAIKPREDDRF